MIYTMVIYNTINTMIFYKKLKLCNKPQVTHLFQIQKSDFRSTFGKNCMPICKEMKVARIEDMIVKNISMTIKMEEQNSWWVLFLKDLLSIRDGIFAAGFENNEIQDINNHICCD